MVEAKTIAELKERALQQGQRQLAAEVPAPSRPPISSDVRSTSAKFVEEFVALNARDAAATNAPAAPAAEAKPVKTPVQQYVESLNSKLPPMDLVQLVVTGRAVQEVPVLSKRLPLSATFQSILASESDWITNTAITAPYNAQPAWPDLARLTIQLKAIDGVDCPSHVGPDGVLSPALFKAKYEFLTSKAETIVKWLMTHNNWFDSRVGELFNDEFEQVKNG